MNLNAGHLKDDHLLECYFAGRTGDPLDPRTADHLSSCTDCGERYGQLVDFMEGVRDQAEEETDAIFTADRLQTQQHQILRRLTHLHRSARVISFPARESAGGPRGSTKLTPRWLAAAAAAGLFIGVAVGGYIGPSRLHRVGTPLSAGSSTTAMTVQRPAPNPAVLVNSTQADSPDDEKFFMELELALARPHTRELQPFDAMTPHVRDLR